MEHMRDTIVYGEVVKVVVELPGVEKKDINIHSQEGRIEVSAGAAERRYRREIDSPSYADTSSAMSIYRNGILEILFQ